MVDSTATNSSRSEIVSISGCLFAICFLTPFFRTVGHVSSFWGGAHFVASLSLCVTMCSFAAILLGSVVTDNHNMSNRDRVRFMASLNVANLLTSFVVARTGLTVFHIEDLSRFRVFVLGVSFLASIMFVTAQHMMMSSGMFCKWNSLQNQQESVDSYDGNHNSTPKKKLYLSRVMRDFCGHENFWAFIGMKMLLECQTNLLSSFVKTLIDCLVFDGGASCGTCGWILLLMRPLTQIAGILCCLPICHMGHQKSLHVCVLHQFPALTSMPCTRFTINTSFVCRINCGLLCCFRSG